MRCWPTCFAILLAVCLSPGCTPEQKSSSPQIIYAGLGVSNYVEIGMTFAEVAKRNRDAEFRPEFGPDTWFWEKPFKKPRNFEIKVPSRGAQSWQGDDRKPITSLNFHLALLPRSTLQTGSNEIVFEPGKRVLRQEIITAFGEPEHHHSFSDATLARSLQKRGESVSLAESNFEHLHYPRSGASFYLDGGVVTGFSIHEKINGTNLPPKP
jgi:hypothetical protein